MPTGPGDDILDAIEAGTADNDILTKYKINNDQLKAFKTLHYGLSNKEMSYGEIKDYFPDLNTYFKGGATPGPKKESAGVIEKPDFTKPVHEKQATESTAAPVLQTKYNQAAAESNKPILSLQQKFNKKAEEGLQSVNKALHSNDDVIKSVIGDFKLRQAENQGYDKFAASPRTDMPAAAQLANGRSNMLPQEPKPEDQPITDEEINQSKEAIQSDPDKARQFINQVGLHKPEQAPELQSSMYMLDAAERLEKNPNIALNVNDNLNKLQKKELKYNAVTRQLTKELGPIDALISGVQERTRQMQNYDLFQGSNESVIKLLEKRMEDYDPDKPVEMPKGFGEITQMLGMEWKTLLRGMATGAVTNGVGGEAATPYISAAINAPEYYKRSYSTAFEESYSDARKIGKKPDEALKIAQDQAKTEGKLGALEGGVSAFFGGRIGLKELPKFNITGGFTNAVSGLLKHTTHFAAETSIEGLADGITAGYLQSLKDNAAMDKGLFRDTEKNIWDNAKGELTFALAFGGMTKLGKTLISPETYKKIRYYLGNQNQEAVQSSLGNAVMTGQISKEDADNITQELKDQQAVDKTVPPDVKDVSRMAMIEKIKERDALEEKKKNIDKALHPEIQEQIDKLNGEILEHSKHIKSNDESETKAETQTDAEADVKAEPGSAQETSQPEAAINNMGEGEAAPVSDNIVPPEIEQNANEEKNTQETGELSRDSDTLKNAIDKTKSGGISDKDYEQEIKSADKLRNEAKALESKNDVESQSKRYELLDKAKQLERDTNSKIAPFERIVDTEDEMLNTKSKQFNETKCRQLSKTHQKKYGGNYQEVEVTNQNGSKVEHAVVVHDNYVYEPQSDALIKKSVFNNFFNTQVDSNAIPEQSTEGVHVPPSSSDSAQVGEGNESQGAVPEETAGAQEIKPELDQVKNSFSKSASSIAEKIRAAKRGGKEAYGGFLGLGVAVYDGMLETAATVIEGGGTIADAIKSAFNYVKANTQTHGDDEIQKAVKDELIGKYVLIDEDQQKAVENLIKKAPATISNEKLVENLVQATGMPKAVIDEMVSEIRKPQTPAPNPYQTARLTPESKQVSINKFKNLRKEQPNNNPGWLKRTWEGVKNGSAWIDNPFRFITKITEDINKEYGLKNSEKIPLGRQFEKSEVGRAVLKVDSFINDVIRGNIGGEKLGKLKGEKYEDFLDFVTAKRVTDRLSKQTEKQAAGENANRQTGNITKQDAEVMLANLKQKYGNLDDFNKRADAFQGHMDGMLKNLVASGILNKETYDKIKADNDFYAPFSVVQSKLVADQDMQSVGISGIVKRIKGIDYKLPTTQGDALTMINALGGALNENIITPEEYFNTSLQILDDARNAGLISDAQYDNHVASLENPGFALNDIMDAAANMIYKSEGLALKNRMLNRLYAYKASDTKGLYIQDVDGFKAVTLPDGSTRMTPKPLNTIKVEPGMAPIKLRVGGKDKIVAVNKQAAAKLNEMNNYETATILKAADLTNKLFRAIVITVSPGFQVANLAIDFTRTVMLSRYGPLAGKGLVQPIVNAALFVPQYMEALLHSAAGNIGLKSKTYKQWMESDSFSKGMFDNLFNNERKIKEVDASLAKRMLTNLVKLTWLDVPGSILEQTHKLATHQRGMSVEGLKPEMVTAMLSSIINRNIKSNMTNAELKDATDRLNYEVQNFAGSPNFPQTHRWMKMTSMFLQFFSARVKGEITDYRRVGNMFTTKGEGVKLSGQERGQLITQFLGAAGMIAAYAIKNNLDDDDEKEFNGEPPYHRDNYLHIPLGYFDYTDESGSTQKLRNYAKLPLRGLTATMNVMANSFVKFYKRQNPEEFKKMAESFLGNASPVNLNGSDERELGESLASNLTPVFKYFIEYSFNRDTHNHRDIVPDFVTGKGMLSKYKQGKIKPWEVFTKKTPQWSKDMSKFLYDNLGIEINAIELDHMENTMGNPTELYDNSLKKRLLRSEMKYPLYQPKENNKNTSSATVTPEGQ